MENSTQEKINRLQKNLSTIRKVAGWTAQQLGDEIGVSRQSISNLEHGISQMSKTQYIALRAVFNYEIAANNNQGLAQVILSLVDNPIQEPEEESTEEAHNAAESQTNITCALANDQIITDKIAEDKKTRNALIAAGLAGSAIPALAPVISQVLAKTISSTLKR